MATSAENLKCRQKFRKIKHSDSSSRLFKLSLLKYLTFVINITLCGAYFAHPICWSKYFFDVFTLFALLCKFLLRVVAKKELGFGVGLAPCKIWLKKCFTTCTIIVACSYLLYIANKWTGSRGTLKHRNVQTSEPMFECGSYKSASIAP